jgi:sarcosine oxidase gamma subunit
LERAVLNISNNDSFVDALENSNEDRTLGGAEAGEENIIRVSPADWQVLVQLSQEERVNCKGKKMALCWQCLGLV